MTGPRRSLVGIAVLVALCASSVARAQTEATRPAATTVTGVIEPVTGHDRSGRTIDRSTLRTPAGTLRLRAAHLGVRAGSRVRVTMHRDRSGRLVASHATVLKAPDQPARAGIRLAHADGAPRAVAFVMVGFAGTAPPPLSVSGLRTILATGASSASAFFVDQSAHQVALTGAKEVGGDVYGPYSVGPVGDACAYEQWSSEASARAAERGVDLSSYSHIVFIWPETASCAWTGLAQTPGRVVWLNGSVGALELAHEIGHNLGLQHANLLTCLDPTGRRVSISANCRSVEQRDPFDVMGNSYRGIGTWNRMQLGWLKGQAVQAVTQSGVYRLELGSGSGEGRPGPIGLAVRRCGSGDLYSVEYRPLSTFGSGETAEGSAVLVRTHPLAAGMWRSQLIDATPQTPSYADAGLAVGATITDSEERITLTTRSASADAAEVEISLPADAAGPGQPGSLVGSATVSPAGATVQLRWAAAKDCGGIQAYAIERNGVRVATTTATRFEDTGLPLDSRMAYSVTAVDLAGNSGRPASVTVTTADQEPPDRPGPLEVRALAAGVRISWAPSTDNLGVVAYSVIRDGAAVGSTSNVIYNDVRTPGKAVARYEVVAIDRAGNRSDATVARADLRSFVRNRVVVPALLKRRPDLRPAGRRTVKITMRVSGPSAGRCRVEARVKGVWRPISRPVPYTGRRCSVVVVRPTPPSLLRVAVVDTGASPVAVSRPVRAFLA